MQLKDQVAIVTGAGTGIGRATALAFAREGAAVVCADINPATNEETVNTIQSTQGRALAVTADVGKLEDIDAMVKRAMAEYGRIDILLANAGVTRRALIMDITEADWDRIHRVNAKGVFFSMQRVAKEMIPRRSGKIINIASIAGKAYMGASNAAYAASKGAVISMTYTAAQQLGQYNINVNAICPGITRTPLSTASLAVRAQEAGVTPEEFDAQRVKAIPLQRANDAEDIAALAVFLASPGARNITGQTINVDGGIIPE